MCVCVCVCVCVFVVHAKMSVFSLTLAGATNLFSHLFASYVVHTKNEAINSVSVVLAIARLRWPSVGVTDPVREITKGMSV